MPESAKEGARPLAESSDIGLGSRDRAFESPHSDQNPSEIVDFRGIFLIFVYCGADVELVILNIWIVSTQAKFSNGCVKLIPS